MRRGEGGHWPSSGAGCDRDAIGIANHPNRDSFFGGLKRGFTLISSSLAAPVRFFLRPYPVKNANGACCSALNARNLNQIEILTVFSP